MVGSLPNQSHGAERDLFGGFSRGSQGHSVGLHLRGNDLKQAGERSLVAGGHGQQIGSYLRG